MPPPPNLGSIKKQFISSIRSARDLANAALALETINPAGRPGLHPKHVRRVVELAFLGVVAAWEDFVEAVFVRYLAGAASPSGFVPTMRVGKAVTVAHAYTILSGNPNYDPEKNYLKFSDPKWIARQAKVFFDQGRPFNIGTAHADALRDAVVIRNRVAHSSKKCKAEFKTVATRRLAPAVTWQGFRAGDLLLHGNPTRQSESLLQLSETLADLLVPE